MYILEQTFCSKVIVKDICVEEYKKNEKMNFY